MKCRWHDVIDEGREFSNGVLRSQFSCPVFGAAITPSIELYSRGLDTAEHETFSQGTTVGGDDRTIVLIGGLRCYVSNASLIRPFSHMCGQVQTQVKC